MKGHYRNAPCPCGSGKKQKRCHPEMKPREQFITIDCGEPVAMTSVELLPHGGLQWFAGERPVTPVAAWHETRRPRDKAPKVMSRVPLDPTTLVANPYAAMQRFRTVLAIDTNTKDVNGERVSIGALAMASFEVSRIKCVHVQALEIRKAVGNPERIMWRLVLSAFESAETPAALVVDSELGLLNQINAGEEPIEGSSYLAAGWCLVYGTADSGADLLPNRMIRECDKRATRLFLELPAAGMSGLNDAPPEEHFAQFRKWHYAG